jgi:hypothetical protein
LQREIDWVLDDAIAVSQSRLTTTMSDMQHVLRHTSDHPVAAHCCSCVQAVRKGPQQQWEPVSWGMLQADVRTALTRQKDPGQWGVQMRLPVAELHSLWHRRLEVCPELCKVRCTFLTIELKACDIALIDCTTVYLAGEGALPVPHRYCPLAAVHPVCGARGAHPSP